MKQFQNATYIIIGKCSLLRQFFSPFVLGIISKLQQGGNLIPINTLFGISIFLPFCIRYQNHQYKNQKCSTKQQQIITFLLFTFRIITPLLPVAEKKLLFSSFFFLFCIFGSFVNMLLWYTICLSSVPYDSFVHKDSFVYSYLIFSKYTQNAVSCILTPSKARWVTSTNTLPSTANGGLTSYWKYWNPV